MNNEIKQGYIRVTDVLDVYFNKENIDPDVLERAKQRGSYLHYWIESYRDGIVLPVPDAWQPYADHFVQWHEEYKNCKFVHVPRVYDDELMLTGEIDGLVEKDGKLILVDYKTSSAPSKSWPLQLAAYARLIQRNCNVGDIDEAIIVHLKKNTKKPKIFTYTKEALKDNWDLYFKAYELYKYFYI